MKYKRVRYENLWKDELKYMDSLLTLENSICNLIEGSDEWISKCKGCQMQKSALYLWKAAGFAPKSREEFSAKPIHATNFISLMLANGKNKCKEYTNRSSIQTFEVKIIVNLKE